MALCLALCAAVLAACQGDESDSRWIPSSGERLPYLADPAAHPQSLTEDGAPLSAEAVCGDFVWLLTHPLPDSADLPQAPYDQGMAALFDGYAQADGVRVRKTARILGEDGAGEGAFRISLSVKEAAPNDPAAADEIRFSRPGAQDWVLEIEEPPYGFTGPFVTAFQSAAKYEDIRLATEQLGGEALDALADFISLVCGPEPFGSPAELPPEKCILYAMIRDGGGNVSTFTQAQVDAACMKYFGLEGLRIPPGLTPPLPQYDPAAALYSWGGFGTRPAGLCVYRVAERDGLLLVTAGLWEPPVVREFTVQRLGDVRFLSARPVDDAELWLSPDWEASRRGPE